MSHTNDAINTNASRNFDKLSQEGRLFVFSQPLNIPAASTYTVCLETGSKQIELANISLVHDQDVTVTLNEGGDWSRGTGSDLPITFLNRNKKDASLISSKDGAIDPSGITLGTEFFTRTLITAVDIGNRPIPSDETGRLGFILATNEVTILQLTNLSGSVLSGSLGFLVARLDQ